MARKLQNANDWIFSILVGKKKEMLICRGECEEFEIKKLEECIESVEFKEGITQEYAENLLRDNFYIGTRAYRHIRSNYGARKKIQVCFKKSLKLQISLDYEEYGRMVIYIPVFDE